MRDCARERGWVLGIQNGHALKAFKHLNNTVYKIQYLGALNYK